MVLFAEGLGRNIEVSLCNNMDLFQLSWVTSLHHVIIGGQE